MAKELVNKFNPLLNKGIQKVPEKLIIDTNHKDLVSMRDNSELLTGHYYRIEYQTKHVMPNSDYSAIPLGTLNTENNVIPTEHLIIQALGNNVLNPICFSEEYPTHKIYYDIDDDTIEITKDYYQETDVIGTSSTYVSGYENIIGWDVIVNPTIYIKVNKAITGEFPFITTTLDVFIYLSSADRDSGINDVAHYQAVNSTVATSVSGWGGNLTVSSAIADGDMFDVTYVDVGDYNYRPGFIKRRIDNIRNIDLPVDFIGYRMRRWSFTVGLTYEPGLTFNRGEIVKYRSNNYIIVNGDHIAEATNIYNAMNKGLATPYESGYIANNPASLSGGNSNYGGTGTTGLSINTEDHRDFPPISDTNGNNTFELSYNIVVNSFDAFYGYNTIIFSNSEYDNSHSLYINEVKDYNMIKGKNSSIDLLTRSYIAKMEYSKLSKCDDNYFRTFSNITSHSIRRSTLYGTHTSRILNSNMTFLINSYNLDLKYTTVSNFFRCENVEFEYSDYDHIGFNIGSVTNIKFSGTSSTSRLNLYVVNDADRLKLQNRFTKNGIVNNNDENFIYYYDEFNNKQFISI